MNYKKFATSPAFHRHVWHGNPQKTLASPPPFPTKQAYPTPRRPPSNPPTHPPQPSGMTPIACGFTNGGCDEQSGDARHRAQE
ncbi:MAG: hypothetical protein KAH86_09905 [Methanosarcinales archaeon]|nr:hypothetical protein [Methanosarcinales archaeon]